MLVWHLWASLGVAVDLVLWVWHWWVLLGVAVDLVLWAWHLWVWLGEVLHLWHCWVWQVEAWLRCWESLQFLKQCLQRHCCQACQKPGHGHREHS